ncbi:polysialyltransferase family glycosyltransferase [Streptomyces sp. NPDC005931]|uniref:polysialyltransferase family glycosyltransferase n=1 Tax=Streptomyces sp. NPDC005931 TaxID=3364737 RepID=UPI0036B27810
MPRVTRIFCAATPLGAATLAAALDAGLFEPADRRLLLLTNNAPHPETTPGVDAVPGFERLRRRFDDVLSWNAAISPLHPRGWSPRADDVPMWERHLRRLWGLGDDEVRLAVESVHDHPSLALCQVFTGAPVDVCADGLVAYGPSPEKLDPLVGTRIDRLLHLDLVPGLTPLLLTEFDVAPEVVPGEALLKVLGELDEEGAEPTGAPENPALLLGQRLAALGALTDAEEEELHLALVRGAVALGHRRLVFAPHPAAPARWSRHLVEEAARHGAGLTVLEGPLPAELAVRRLRPAVVVGGSSTALFTTAALYGVPVARAGTRELLARITPYHHRHRVPAVVADVLLPDAGDREAVEHWTMPSRERVAELAALLRAVGYAMQPRVDPGLRGDAESYLSARLSPATRPYFTRRRLTSLALPGAVPARLAFVPRNATVRRIARRARSLVRR